MKVSYDFHIHSALSPCADDDMTPANIVGFAKLGGVQMIALSDHNAIDNVKVAMKIGEEFGVVVVPALELQTTEEIHFLCLFKTFDNLEKFYDKLCFLAIKNRPDLYGEQLIFDENDNIVGKRENLLLTSASLSSSEVLPLAKKFGGIAIPAHIDRDSNSIVQILGTVTDEFGVVELSKKANKEEIEKYTKKFKVLFNSDAHNLSQIIFRKQLELEECSIPALFKFLESK